MGAAAAAAAAAAIAAATTITEPSQPRRQYYTPPQPRLDRRRGIDAEVKLRLAAVARGEYAVAAATDNLALDKPAHANQSNRPLLQGNLQLGLYAQALLDELDDLAKTDEAEPKDRLCYPPEAVASARGALGVRREL